MGRRRRKKVVKVTKRGLPKVYTCPKCGLQSVKVTLDKVRGKADVSCSSCGLKGEIPTTPTSEAVDVYSEFCDLFYSGKGKIEEGTPTTGVEV